VSNVKIEYDSAIFKAIRYLTAPTRQLVVSPTRHPAKSRGVLYQETIWNWKKCKTEHGPENRVVSKKNLFSALDPKPTFNQTNIFLGSRKMRRRRF